MEDCQSRCIDLFDSILNNKVEVFSIVKKASEGSCELNPNNQLLRSRDFLLTDCLLLISSTLIRMNQSHSKSAAKKNKTDGVKVIKNARTLMH